MLVLSRRPNEKIVFPSLGITVEVLNVKGGALRLGIEAPPDVSILRAELAGAEAERPGRDPALLNRLNNVSLALHQIRRLIDAGRDAEAAATLETAFPALQELEQELSARREAGLTSHRPAGRALIVEDDDNERELLAGLLRMNGLDCRTAADGRAALDYLAANDRPDLVLLDLWMPGCDGRQTLRQIREDQRLRGLRVFAVSGTSPRDAGLEIGPNGLDAWFPKPLDTSRLWEAIQKEVSPAHRTN